MLFQLLRAACIPGLMASLQSPCLPSQPLLLPLLLTRMLVITRSPFWTIQDCPFFSALNSIPSAKCPLPQKRTYSQALGLRMWTSGSHQEGAQTRKGASGQRVQASRQGSQEGSAVRRKGDSSWQQEAHWQDQSPDTDTFHLISIHCPSSGSLIFLMEILRYHLNPGGGPDPAEAKHSLPCLVPGSAWPKSRSQSNETVLCRASREVLPASIFGRAPLRQYMGTADASNRKR